MRRVLTALAALCAFPALADVYNVSAAMPCTSGATQAKKEQEHFAKLWCRT